MAKYVFGILFALLLVYLGWHLSIFLRELDLLTHDLKNATPVQKSFTPEEIKQQQFEIEHDAKG